MYHKSGLEWLILLE